MRYILTGHKGLIGDYLKRELDKKHECVMNIDIRDGFNVLNMDSVLLNPETQKVDILFHSAAHCKIAQGIEHPELPHINNCDGTFRVLEFCRKNNIKKVVFFSSSRVLSENENPYTASKKYGELLMKAYQECYGIDYLIIRPSTVYGPGFDTTSRLITSWCIDAIRGRPLLIFGDEKKTLDFTHIDDFVRGVMLLVEKWNETKNNEYNLSGDNEVNLSYLADLIRSETDIKSEIIYMPKEKAQPQNVKIDNTKMRELGYNPLIKIEQGVTELIKWHKQNLL